MNLALIPFTPPQLNLRSFNCPHCQTRAHHYWYPALYRPVGSNAQDVPALKVAFCEACGKYSLWLGGEMIFPNGSTVGPPNLDLRQDIQDDYNEAKSILTRSPRGAAAILRLCVEKLCQQLGLQGKDLDKDIGELVKKGLPVDIQRALDLVRVIGNYSVHPGVLDLKDDVDTATKLFGLVNHIAYSMITQPRDIGKLFEEKVLAPQKRSIQKRDSAK